MKAIDTQLRMEDVKYLKGLREQCSHNEQHCSEFTRLKSIIIMWCCLLYLAVMVDWEGRIHSVS